MLSSELGGVVGAGPEAGTEATPEARPRARNCWWRRLGRKGLPGIICMVAVSDVLAVLKLSVTKETIECLVMAGQFHGDESISVKCKKIIRESQ